jgi:hypothetical protein
MKKWFVVLLAFLVLLLACLYIFIPGTVSIQEQKAFSGNAHILYRVVMNAQAPFWKQDNKLSYNGRQYRIVDQKLNSLIIDIDGIPSQLNFISAEADSVTFTWQMRIPMPVSPFSRVSSYNSVKGLKKDIDTLLAQMQAYGANADRVYGRHIEEAHVRDSILLFTYGETEGYPSIPYIYRLIDELKAYTASQSANITGPSMLHITTDDSVHFLTKVALPVDKRLKSFGKISYKWMLGGGNILVTDVHGGPWAIQQAYMELDKYADDHQRVAPAIPFESLLTDRLQEKDTSKWVTRIYYPVM